MIDPADPALMEYFLVWNTVDELYLHRHSPRDASDVHPGPKNATSRIVCVREHRDVRKERVD